MSADILTVRDLAERWHVAPATVRTWVLEGEAPKCFVVGKRVRRFHLKDVEAFEREREHDLDADTRFDDWRFDSDADPDLPDTA